MRKLLHDELCQCRATSPNLRAVEIYHTKRNGVYLGLMVVTVNVSHKYSFPRYMQNHIYQ